MTDTSKLPFALDYGLNAPQPLAAQQSNQEFIDSITRVDLNYDYSNVEATYDARTFFEQIADETSNIASATSGYVWDTATGTWDTVKTSALGVVNAVTDTGKEIFSAGVSVIDGTILRLVIVFAVIIAGLYFLAKSGFIKDAAAFV